MIVTADATGDYNATSQILRYGALAREVTVPRIPSITEAITQAKAAPMCASGSGSRTSSNPALSPIHYFSRSPFFSPRMTDRSPNTLRSFSPTSPSATEDRITMEHAALKISRLSEEVRQLEESLSYEREARLSAEAHLISLDDKMLELEQAIREDCVAEFEQRLALELARWKTGLQVALERGEEHWDRKMEVFERSLALQAITTDASGGHEDAVDNKENDLVESLEEENARLRRELTILKRELAGRTPSKRAPLMDREDFSASTSVNVSPRLGRSRNVSREMNDENIQGELLHRRIENLTLRADGGDQRSHKKGSGSEHSSRASSHSRAGTSGSPMKRVRKLTARKWGDGLDGGDDVF